MGIVESSKHSSSSDTKKHNLHSAETASEFRAWQDLLDAAYEVSCENVVPSCQFSLALIKVVRIIIIIFSNY